MSLSKRKKLEDLPDEVILKIFSFLDIKDILRCSQMSKRIRSISNDPSLWQKLNLSWGTVPYEFIEKANQNGCKYLSMAGTGSELIRGDRLEMPLELKYLDLSQTTKYCNLPMLKNCHSLEKLSMDGCHFSNSTLNHLAQNGKTLKILSLRDISFRDDEVGSHLLGNALKSCIHLTELSLCNFKNHESVNEITCIVDNLTPNILKLDLSYTKVEDKHVNTLVKRCKKLTELDLMGTSISKDSIDSIVTHLNPTLVKLNVAYTNIPKTTELLPLRSMKSLKWLLCLTLGVCEEPEIEDLRKELFNTSITSINDPEPVNDPEPDPDFRPVSFGIASSTPNDVYHEQDAHKYGFWEIKAKQQEVLPTPFSMRQLFPDHVFSKFF